MVGFFRTARQQGPRIGASVGRLEAEAVHIECLSTSQPRCPFHKSLSGKTYVISHNQSRNWTVSTVA